MRRRPFTILNFLGKQFASSATKRRADERFWEEVKSLCEFRWRVLVCVGDCDPTLRERFNPAEPATLAHSLRQYLESVWARELPRAGGEPQFNGLAVVAAGLLTYGRLEMADYIAANVPPQRIKLDNGAGWCNVIAFRITAHMLPLPEHLRRYLEWYEGSPATREVLAWLAANRDRLRWDSTSERMGLDRITDSVT